jgi:hypothetical protein
VATGATELHVNSENQPDEPDLTFSVFPDPSSETHPVCHVGKQRLTQNGCGLKVRAYFAAFAVVKMTLTMLVSPRSLFRIANLDQD